MSSVVLDASVVASWFLPKQATPSSEALLADTHLHRFTAPFIFPAEVANVFRTAERKGAMSIAATGRAFATLAGLDLDLAPPVPLLAMPQLLDLARAELLTSYDALYLQLAIDTAGLLATRDEELLEAAARRGVAVMDLRA